jgi:hypothetical protein
VSGLEQSTEKWAEGKKSRCLMVGLLELAKELGNVSRACKVISYSRDSFYRFKELYDKGGELALQEISCRKNRTPIAIEQAVAALAIRHPASGQVRISEALTCR